MERTILDTVDQEMVVVLLWDLLFFELLNNKRDVDIAKVDVLLSRIVSGNISLHMLVVGKVVDGAGAGLKVQVLEEMAHFLEHGPLALLSARVPNLDSDDIKQNSIERLSPKLQAVSIQDIEFILFGPHVALIHHELILFSVWRDGKGLYTLFTYV